MTLPVPNIAVNGTIQTVRQLLGKNGHCINDLCAAINNCANSKAHRYVISSVDSVFDDVHIPSSDKPGETDAEKTLTKTLFKLPRAVYMPRNSDTLRPGPNFGSIVDEQLKHFTEDNVDVQEYASLVEELTNTVEFISENALDAFHGPLRPSTVKMLNSYKDVLLKDKRIGDLKKLRYATQLMNVLKIHSVDSDDLENMIIEILKKTPNIVRQCKTATLESLFKMRLPVEVKATFDEYIRMASTKYLGIDEWSDFLWMVARCSDNRNTIDCYLQSYNVVMRNAQREGTDKNITNSALMNILYAVATLQTRLRHSDPVFKNALRILESIWYFVEDQIATFEPTELIDIAKVYFGNHLVVNPLMKNGGRNYLDFLVTEISQRSEELLLKDWISLIDAVDGIRDAMVVNVLQDQQANYYTKVGTIQKAWVERLVVSLKQNELTDVADSIYSLSLPQCSTFCKYLVIAGLYEEPLSAIIERRCLSLITDVKYHTSRHIYDYYFAQFQMALPSHNGLRIALESNKKLSQLLLQMSANNILRLLRLAKYCSPGDCRILLHTLAAKIESGVVTLSSQQNMAVLKHASHFKDTNLLNAVIASLTPKLLSSAEPHKGFSKLLDISKFVLSMSKDEHYEQSVSPVLNELIVQHAPAHVRHLSPKHLDLLLQNVKCAGCFPRSLIGDIISHALEVDLSATAPSQITSILCTLADIGIRHEYLVERLENCLLVAMLHMENEEAAQVMTAMANSMARIGMKSSRLNEFFERLLVDNNVPITKWNYEALEMTTKVSLLHAIGHFGTINDAFDKAFTALVFDCEKAVKDAKDTISFAKLDPLSYRKIYDTYITLLMNGFAGSSETSELTKSDFLLDHLPCYHWFKYQEHLCEEFKDSPHYVQLKNTLQQIGIEDAESRITDVYFAHMVLDSPECASSMNIKKTALFFVPTKDELKWWTSKGDTNTDPTANMIESYKYAIGESARVIDHLQKSGWNVITLFMPEWDAMDASERERYLKIALKLNTEPL